MKKYIVIFVILVGIAFFIARQDERAAQQSAKESTHLDKRAFPTDPNEKHPEKDVPDSKWHAPSWLVAFFRWPNGTATWVVILTIMAIAEQTGETAKAAKAVVKQTKQMSRQNRNMVAKERARIFLIPPEQAPFLHLGKPIALGDLKLRVLNVGETPALDVMGEYEAFACEMDAVPNIRQRLVMIMPNPVRSGTPEMTNTLLIRPRFKNYSTIPLTFYLYVQGRVIYSDVFHTKPNEFIFQFRREYMLGSSGEAFSNMPWEEFLEQRGK
jgi:hypothetical protein